MTNITDLIEQQKQIDAAAWQTFSEDYERRNPPPAQDNRVMLIGMTIGLVSALFLSGLLTVPAFMRVLAASGEPIWLQVLGGIAGFIAVDVVMFIATYYLTSTYYKPKALEGQMDFGELLKGMQIAAVFGFIVSVSSNLFFVLIGYEVIDPTSGTGRLFSLFVAVLLAFAPPVQAGATGSIMALLPLTSLLERQAYEQTRQGAWTRYRSKFGLNLDVQGVIDTYTKAAAARLSTQTDNRQTIDRHGDYDNASVYTDRQQTDNRQTGAGYNRVSSAVEIALKYLQDNPDGRNLSVRELGEAAGVGKDSAAKAIRQFKGE